MEIFRQPKSTKRRNRKRTEGKRKETANKLIREGGTKSQMFWKLREGVLNNKAQNTYDTISENDIRLEDSSSQLLANFYENGYQAREGKPGYREWT